MARHRRRPAPTSHRFLVPLHTRCWVCGGPAWMAYHATRTVATLEGLCHCTLKVRRGATPACPLYHQPYRPEDASAVALPPGEFGLDVIALIGALRYTPHRSVPEMQRDLCGRGVRSAERTVTDLLQRSEERVALRLGDQTRRHARLAQQGRVILASDGLQPDVGHEILWILRDCLAGEVLLARSLLSATEADLAGLLREVQQALAVPSSAVLSDGQHSLRNAVQQVLPAVPHHLCQFHYLRDAAQPLYEADRHAKKELKKQVRGVRPSERARRPHRSGGGGHPGLLPGGAQRTDGRWPAAPRRCRASLAGAPPGHRDLH